MKANMRRGLAFVLAAVASLSLCACGGGSSAGSAAGSTAGSSAAAPEAANGDVSICRIVQSNEPIVDWDPAISYNGDILTYRSIYETLLVYDPATQEYQNVLATDYESSDDGLVWTFHLREGVKFHDGTDFNADAVKYSIERNKSMDKGAAYIWEPLDEVVVVDDYTVELHLNSPCNMAEVVSCQWCAFIYSPSAGADNQESSKWFYEGNECGSGPYTIQSWTPGSDVVLTRFEDYWGGWEGDHFDKAIVQMVSESSTRRQMIESGEADVAMHLTTNDIEAVSDSDGITTVIDEYTAKGTQVWFNFEKEPLQDINLRKALAYSCPFEEVLEYTLLNKYGRTPTDVLCPSGAHGATDSQPYHYDIDLAKEYLSKSAFPDGGIELVIAVANHHEQTKSILEQWQSELSKLNIKLVIEPNAEDAMISTAKGPVEQQQDLLVEEMSIDLLSSYAAYVSAAATGASWNFANYSDEWVDENLKKVNELGATDLEASDKLMQEIGTRVAEDCMCFNIADRNDAFAVRDNFEGFVHNTAMQGVYIYDCHRV